MRVIRIALGPFLLVTVVASASMAQVQRTFVSGLGNDGNPCTRTAPCRSFAQAISQTNSSGEVYVLDSAGYAPFTITKPISIVAPSGVAAGISVFLSDGITVNAGASDTIILRGLTVNNQTGAGSGILFNTGGTLHIEDCVVSGFTTLSAGVAGIRFQGSGRLEIKDSIMRNNTKGISIQPPMSGMAVAAVDHVRVDGGLDGIEVFDGSKVVVRNSLASDNSGNGFVGIAISATTEMNIEGCLAFNNGGSGIMSQTSNGIATVRVSNSTVTNNFVGFTAYGASATLLSRANNTLEGNAAYTFTFGGGTIGVYNAK